MYRQVDGELIPMWRGLLFFFGAAFASITAAAQALIVNEVAPGIYVHFGKQEFPDKNNHGAIANIGFIIGKQCVAVIDSGGNPQQGYALLAAVKQKTTLPVCYVINTHVHPDHVFGNIAFKNPGVKFVGHQKLPRALAMRGAYYIDRAARQLAVILTEKHVIPPRMLVKEKLVLDLGGREITLTAYPTAHTDNDLSVYDAETDTLWLSDVLFLEHIPVLDGSLLGWLQVIDDLEQRHFQRVIPGHGPLVTDWPESIQEQKAYLQKLRDDIRLAIKQGLYLEQTVNKLDDDTQQNWLLYNDFHRKNITAAYAELEWEE